ncbi:MAG: hypothetical protein JWP37_1874 [Mucilaginibacter sp.]|nr:hypothetical protein [Mucilaginibacter sp.]
MIKYTRLFITFLLAVFVLGARAQSTATTSSPYSRYGIGLLDDQLLPQNIGMGGIATATNTIGGYNSINVINPASYSKITFTTIDVGVYSNMVTFSKDGYTDQKNSNTRLSHIAFAFPVTKHSALSFGLLPYSELGYNYKQALPKGFGTKPTPTGGTNVDTNAVNYIYSGEGGLSKAYLGYGFGIGKHLLIGANISYIFGNLQQDQSTEIPNLYGTLDSRIEQSSHVGGLNYDYGVQYSIDFSDTKHLNLGYSASANSRLNVQNTYIVSQYTRDASGNENVPLDTLVNNKSANAKLQLPQINHFGIAFIKDNSFIIGADYTTGKWSDLSIAGTNSGLQNSQTFNLGGQITPNANALSNYLALMEYKAGIIYEKTYLNVNNVNIKRYAATFGLGLPLPHDRASSAFYKVNFSAEIGKRGTLTNGLVQENYVNFHLGFTLNDRWFQRYKYE